MFAKRSNKARRIERLAIATAGVGIGIAWLFAIAHVLHFDGLYGQDPYAYYDYGQQIGQLIAHGHGLGYMYWPLGYPALLGVAFLIGGVTESSAQLVTILCSAAAAVLTGLLTAEIAFQLHLSDRLARIGALLAWLLMLCSGQAIQSGIVVMADMPALMWATLSAWALACYLRLEKPGWIGLAAFALAWATMSRWQYVALALPWGIACLWRWLRSAELTRLAWLRHLLVAIIIGLTASAPQIVYTWQNPDPALHHEWLTGWSPANAFNRDFVTADGTFHYDLPVAEYYLLPLTSAYYSSAFLLPLIVIGLLALVRLDATTFTRRNAEARAPTINLWSAAVNKPVMESYEIDRIPLIILTFGWIAVEYGFLIGIPYQNIRFALAFFHRCWYWLESGSVRY